MLYKQWMDANAALTSCQQSAATSLELCYKKCNGSL